MFEKLTCTLDSGKLIFKATSSRMKMSGYLVLPNNDSNISNWALVNVVLSRRCFLGLTPKNRRQNREHKFLAIYYLIKFSVYKWLFFLFVFVFWAAKCRLEIYSLLDFAWHGVKMSTLFVQKLYLIEFWMRKLFFGKNSLTLSVQFELFMLPNFLMN